MIAPSMDNPAATNAHPDCDGCGKDSAGRLQCSRCLAVFYCSTECQRKHWKGGGGGGHKQQCIVLKEEVEQAGMFVVQRMSDTRIPFIGRVQGLDDLDGSGPYKIAVCHGLHSAMKDLFQSDLDTCLDRHRRRREHYSTTQFIMVTIFRGQRREGKGECAGNSFRCVDGDRIKSYVMSSEDAFDVWFDASLAVYRTALDDEVYRTNRMIQAKARQSARDIFAGWLMVFTNRKASKAIILGSSSSSTTSSASSSSSSPEKRVTSIINRIKDLLHERWEAFLSDEKDPNGTLEGMVYQMAAMISYWSRTFDVPVNVEKLLALRGAHKHMYHQMAVPLGEATIAKGFNLTNDEARIAIQHGFLHSHSKEG